MNIGSKSQSERPVGDLGRLRALTRLSPGASPPSRLGLVYDCVPQTHNNGQRRVSRCGEKEMLTSQLDNVNNHVRSTMLFGKFRTKR